MKLKQKGKDVIIVDEQGTVNGLINNGVRMQGPREAGGLGRNVRRNNSPTTRRDSRQKLRTNKNRNKLKQENTKTPVYERANLS